MTLLKRRNKNVRTLLGAAVIATALTVSASPVVAADCQTATGKGALTLVPAPNDPLGRLVGPTIGSLKAAVSSILTSLAPNPNGSLHATTVETWVLGPQDILQFAGDATFTPVPGAPIGTVSDSLTLTVVGGSGKYVGATGTLNVTGTGYNLFGPNAGPGSSFFDVRYSGFICQAN